jgi:DNA-binding PadR family transcriptional regulator
MDTGKQSFFYRNVVEQVINSETVPIRFENFANAVVSKLEGGAPVLGTSTSWDRGRDGVGFGSASGLFVLTSLRDDVDAKFFSDLERIRETTPYLKSMYFCTSQPLSEHRRDQLRSQLNEETDGLYSIEVLGSGQITELAIQYDDLADRTYSAEINDIIKVLTTEPGASLQENGFRLAMLSSASETSDQIRSEVYRTRLLDALRDGRSRTAAAVCKTLSDALHLGRNIPESTLTPYLKALVEDKAVFFDGIVYNITPTGQSEIEKRANEGVGRLLELKKAIQLALEKGLGESLQIDHFNQIWAAFETSISYYFTARGEAVVYEIRRIFGEQPEDLVTTQPESSSFLDEVASQVGATSTNSERRQDLEQAVKDIFSDRNGPAADWLIRISANFMSACAMGIEGSTSRAIHHLFSKTRLLLDTDVILSLLGHGEPEHDGVEALVDRWRKMGGAVYTASPVLEEVARHAFIAEHDMHQVRSQLPGSPEDRAHLIGNAFVRSFAELMASNNATMREWREFMRQYRGLHEYDTSVISETLLGDFGVQVLPDFPLKFAEYELEVRTRLINAAREDFGNDERAIDKAKRDSRLYVGLIAQLEQLRGIDPGSTCLLVSSARRLSDLQRDLGRGGDEQLVVSVAGALYLLSLLPDVSLGLSAMKAFLFDERRSVFSGDFERTILRLVRGSDRIMPFAKRASLMRSLRRKLITNAVQYGEKTKGDQTRRLEQDAFAPDNQARTIELLTNALNDVGVESRSERELKEARKRISDLESQLARVTRRQPRT